VENILNLTPFQSLIILALNVWIFIVFPAIVIKKLNHMTDLLEAQYLDEDKENDQQVV